MWQLSFSCVKYCQYLLVQNTWSFCFYPAIVCVHFVNSRVRLILFVNLAVNILCSKANYNFNPLCRISQTHKKEASIGEWLSVKLEKIEIHEYFQSLWKVKGQGLWLHDILNDFNILHVMVKLGWTPTLSMYIQGHYYCSCQLVSLK